MGNNPFLGARYFLHGLRLINRPGVRRFVAIPLLINVLLFTTLIGYGWMWLERLRAVIEQWLPTWLGWLSWLLIPLFIVTAVLALVYGFSLVANLLAAPFNTLLAQAVERTLTDKPIPSANTKGLIREILVSIASEFRKLGYFLGRALPLLLLFLIPGLNLAAPLLWLLFSAWVLALEYADYPMANHGISFTLQRKLLARKRWLGMGFGATVMLAMLIPVLNFLAIPTAVAGATALWVEQLRDEETPSAWPAGPNHPYRSK